MNTVCTFERDHVPGSSHSSTRRKRCRGLVENHHTWIRSLVRSRESTRCIIQVVGGVKPINNPIKPVTKVGHCHGDGDGRAELCGWARRRAKTPCNCTVCSGTHHDRAFARHATWHICACRSGTRPVQLHGFRDTLMDPTVPVPGPARRHNTCTVPVRTVPVTWLLPNG